MSHSTRRTLRSKTQGRETCKKAPAYKRCRTLPTHPSECLLCVKPRTTALLCYMSRLPSLPPSTTHRTCLYVCVCVCVRSGQNSFLALLRATCSSRTALALRTSSLTTCTHTNTHTHTGSAFTLPSVPTNNVPRTTPHDPLVRVTAFASLTCVL